MNVGRYPVVSRHAQYFFLVCLLTRAVLASAPSLTIYNQNFAVVRDSVALDLQPGTNLVRFDGCAGFLEPSSVVLRDPAAKHAFQILEQNFRYDSVSQEKLLELNEGKVISFEMSSLEGAPVRREIVPGRIVRSGPLPLIEMNGHLRFGLPGQPLFPALGDNTILKPTLVWLVRADAAARFEAELSYVTGEMQWEADYNLVLPEQGETLDLAGWITMDNQTGKSFENARIKLMAGDVKKIRRFPRRELGGGGGIGGGYAGAPPVTEKSFDEYHLYTLDRPATLLDHEKKQVEFIRAGGVRSKPLYVYDGASMEPDQVWLVSAVHTEPEYGTQENRNIWVFREFTNSATNQLGVPLPRGTLRLYRRDSDGQLEFTGESTIKHTPRDETVRLFTGNSFDVVGRRRQTDFKARFSGMVVDPVTGLPVAPKSQEPPSMDESIEITLNNHKRETVQVRVVEHLYRGASWLVQQPSQVFEKTDAQTLEFKLELKPDTEQKISYTAHYSW